MFLDNGDSAEFYPLNALKKVQELHFGVRAIAKQWQEVLRDNPQIQIHSRLLPTQDNVSAVLGLMDGDGWTRHGELVAMRGNEAVNLKELPDDALWLKDAAHLFELCGVGLAEDLSRLQLAWRLRALQENEREAWQAQGVQIHGPMSSVWLAPGAVLRDVSLNTEEGPVVVGPDAEIMEGCRVRGPFALGDGSQLRMGTLVYGATTVGQGCKMGGELSNVVVHDWSNKAHGGFLGNAVLGSWCNLGAETTCSNLKNTYGVIAEWSEGSQSFESRGRQFCGLLMGDHSKTAIHTAFSTATVVGVMANVFGDQTPPRHVQSFQWGVDGTTRIDLDKGLEVARKVMARRKRNMSADEEHAIRALFSR